MDLFDEMSENHAAKESAGVKVEQGWSKSADLAMDKGSNKRPAETPPMSPVRQRTGAATVDLEMLKQLLADQSAMILEQQRTNMTDMLRGLRDEIKEGDSKLLAEIQTQKKDIGDLKARAEGVDDRLRRLEQAGEKGTSPDILDRIQKLETAGGSSMASTGEPAGAERHRFTLIFGGWKKDSPRKLIVEELHAGLQQAQLSHLTDYPGFTTGPRKSLALMQFRVRKHEDMMGMRDRMQRIISTLGNAGVQLRQAGKLWASFSRPKAERDRGSHAAMIRRVVRSLRPEKEELLEAEYSTGSTWVDSYKLSSASVPPGGLDPGDIQEFDAPTSGATRPWINVAAMAECLGVTQDQVRREVSQQVRPY